MQIAYSFYFLIVLDKLLSHRVSSCRSWSVIVRWDHRPILSILSSRLPRTYLYIHRGRREKVRWLLQTSGYSIGFSYSKIVVIVLMIPIIVLHRFWLWHLCHINNVVSLLIELGRATSLSKYQDKDICAGGLWPGSAYQSTVNMVLIIRLLQRISMPRYRNQNDSSRVIKRHLPRGRSARQRLPIRIRTSDLTSSSTSSHILRICRFRPCRSTIFS